MGDGKEAVGEDLSKLLKTHLEKTEERHRMAMKESEATLQEKWIHANIKDKEDERIRGNMLRDEQLQEVKKNYSKELAELSLKLQKEDALHRKEQEKIEIERQRFIEIEEEAKNVHQKELEQMEIKFKNELSESNDKWKNMIEESATAHQKEEESWKKEKENARMQ